MSHLKKKDETLYYKVQSETSSNYVGIHNEDGSLNVYSKRDDQFLYPFSNIQENMDISLVGEDIQNLSMCFLFGCGIGYELTTLLTKTFKKYNTKYLIVIEKDIELFKKLLEVIDISNLIDSDHIDFIVGVPEEHVYAKVRQCIENNDRTYYVKSMNIVGNVKNYELNQSYYSNISKSIREALVGLFLSLGNDPYDALIGIQNMFHSISDIIESPGINTLYSKFSGKPAVIASTGPSLDKNVHLLKGLEDKVLILCPDASLKILLAKGIKPHIVVSLERTNGILKFYKDLTEDDLEQTYFMFTPVLTQEVLQAFKGRKFTVYRDYKHFDWLEVDKGKHDIKSSSGNMAFKVAQVLGCDPIVLIGQDLAFAKDGNTHAKGMALGTRIEEHYERGVVEVMGNDGEMIKTSMIMFPFIKEFELDLSKHNGRVINATEGGAKIVGAEVKTFKETIDQYIQESYDPSQILSENYTSFVSENHSDVIGHLIGKIDGALRDFEYLNTLALEGLTCIQASKDQMKQSIEQGSITFDFELLLNKLSEIRRRFIEEKNETFSMLLGQVIQSYFVKFLVEEKEVFGNVNRTWLDEIHWVSHYESFFSDMSHIVLIVMRSLEDAQNILSTKRS